MSVTQLDIFDPPAQAHSPTSRAAATAIKPSRSTLREQVFAAIDTHGPLSDEAGADLLSMNPSTYRPRRIELQRAGRIRAALELATTRSGRKAVAWEAV